MRRIISTPKTLTALERYLEQKNDVWENSWVRFPEQCLNTYAREVFAAYLHADKANPGAGLRSDVGQFRFIRAREAMIPNTRKSRRYPGYTRIKLSDYKQALIDTLKTDGRALADSFRMQAALSDLQGRINEFTRMDLWANFREPAFKDIIRTILPDLDLDVFSTQVKMPLMGHTLSVEKTRV